MPLPYLPGAEMVTQPVLLTVAGLMHAGCWCAQLRPMLCAADWSRPRLCQDASVALRHRRPCFPLVAVAVAVVVGAAVPDQYNSSHSHRSLETMHD